MWWMDCRAKFGPLQLDFYCVKPCEGKTVDLEGCFLSFWGLDGGPWGLGKRDGLQGCGRGPRMRLMGCLANSGPLQLDFT